MATLEDIKKQLQSDRKVNEAISRGTHDTLRTNKKILSEILEHFKGIKAAAAVEAADRKEQKREDATAGSKPGGSTRFSGFLPKGVKDGLGSLMGFVKKGLLIAAIPAILAFINSDYWPKFRDTMMDLAKKIKMVYEKYLVPFGEYLKGAFLKTWELINAWWPTVKLALTTVYEDYLKPIGNFFGDQFILGLGAIKDLLYGGKQGPQGRFRSGGLVGMFKEFKDGNIFSGLKMGFDALYNFFGTILQGTVNNVYDLLADMFSWQKREGDINVIGEILGFFTNMYDLVKMKFKDSLTQIKKAFDNLFRLETLEALFARTFPSISSYHGNPFSAMIAKRDAKAAQEEIFARNRALAASGPEGGIGINMQNQQIASQIPERGSNRIQGPVIGGVQFYDDDFNSDGTFSLSGKRRFKEKFGIDLDNQTIDIKPDSYYAENRREQLNKIKNAFVAVDEFINKNMVKTFDFNLEELQRIKNTSPQLYRSQVSEMIKQAGIDINPQEMTIDKLDQILLALQGVGSLGNAERSNNTQINNVGDLNAYLINGANSTHDTSDPKLLYGTDQI